MKSETHERTGSDPYLKQRILTVLAAVLLLVGAFWAARLEILPAQPSLAALSRPCLIIDPGHGGIDGGALAYNGVKESDLNLSIALKLRDLAAFYGCETVMTREDDSRRTDILSYSEHEDLVHRAELVNGVPNGLLLSIHQNCFPTSQPSGAQVLYGPGEESRRWGELTHSCILSALQPENRRVAEPASPGLYLTAHAQCPAILVECGFLSNLSDLQLLSSEKYQRSFAAALLSAYLQYTAPVA